ncbi:MAG: helix-turn-helix domain-containing protein [Verrucomicrobia bacterium]|nr:helix-turn-helix domain-containing protein [Verrucomicrobiota bacterium]
MSYRIAISLRSKPLLSLAKSKGVLRRASGYADWQIVSTAAWTPFEQLLAKSSRYDAALVEAFNLHELQQLQALEKPMVETSNVVAESPFVRVVSDDYAIGRLAAQHLAETGVRDLAYLGVNGHQYSDLRCRGFVETLSLLGMAAPQILHVPASDTGPGPFVFEQLTEWLQKQKFPLGAFCCNDTRLLFLLQAIYASNLELARDVHLVGVDCEPIADELFGDRFAYVQQDSETIGWEAAGQLHALLSETAAIRKNLLIPPKGLIHNRTKVETTLDRSVREACDWLRQHVSEPNCVEELARHMGLSRRSLERKFQASLGHGPKTEQLRIRIDIARDQLETTDMSLVAISEGLGFADQRQLSRLFRRFHHETPAAYRRSRRNGGAI